MFHALHPTKNILISYSEYLEFVLANDIQEVNNALKAKCPVCKAQMNVRAGKKKDDGHFYHLNVSSCPTIEPSSQPYKNLPPSTTDKNTANSNRNFVADNMSKIWSRVNEIVPYLDLKEFIKILDRAKQLNIYGYINLNPELIPYTYVTLINFLPSKSQNKQRKLKFCFFYESISNTTEGLWFNNGNPSRLIRISYYKNVANKVVMIDTTTEYLIESKYQLTDKQLAWCLNRL